MTGDVLAAALRHAERGRPVFPCDSRSKRPTTTHGFQDATRDRDTIQQWFGGGRLPMLGLPTGAVTGLVVLDTDPRHGGDESLHDLERQHGPLPATATVTTPSGGAHYYFRWPGERVRSSAGTIAPGIDVRADGAYVIAPPSATSDGRRYVVDCELPPAPMPDWLLALTRERSDGERRAAPPSEWLEIARGLPEGRRDQGLTRLVGHLLRRYVDVDLVAELAQLVNGRCRPPLPAADVDRIIDSIAARELRRRTRQ